MERYTATIVACELQRVACKLLNKSKSKAILFIKSTVTQTMKNRLPVIAHSLSRKIIVKRLAIILKVIWYTPKHCYVHKVAELCKIIFQINYVSLLSYQKAKPWQASRTRLALNLSLKNITRWTLYVQGYARTLWIVCICKEVNQ